ncbi:MAG: uridine kinase [Oscillospiraceae bacterium]|nr:uridine kinase [Oscillospiraceae bacterium]
MIHVKKIADTIMDQLRTRDTAVLGIDGLGGAGKSTISEGLRAELESRGIMAVLLHIDDFIHTRSIRYDERFPEWECYYDIQWRYDYINDTIAALKACKGGDVRIELYDKDNDSYYTDTVTVGGKTVIVVEGIFLQRKEYRGSFDYMVYIDIPEEERLRRVLSRDTYIGSEKDITAKYENRYFPAERRYVDEYRPAETADYVIG